jgi:hypothetical protein
MTAGTLEVVQALFLLILSRDIRLTSGVAYPNINLPEKAQLKSTKQLELDDI